MKLNSINHGVFALLLGAFILLSTDAAQAQPGGGRGGRGMFGGPGGPGGPGGNLVMLAGQKSVQIELKTTDEQAKAIAALEEKQHGPPGGPRDMSDLSPEERQKHFEERIKEQQKLLGEVLQPDQLKRLNQISLQLRGVMAFASPEVADSLLLSREQKDKIRAIGEESRESMREMFKGSRPGSRGDRKAFHEKMEAARKASTDKAVALLTDEQKSKWNELTGAPFTGEIAPPRGGPRGEGNRRRSS